MCVSGLFGRNASGRGRTWHVHARRMNMAGCWTWVLEAHGEQGVQMKAHFYSPRADGHRAVLPGKYCSERARVAPTPANSHQLFGNSFVIFSCVAMQEAEQIAVGDGDEGCCCIKPVF